MIDDDRLITSFLAIKKKLEDDSKAAAKKTKQLKAMQEVIEAEIKKRLQERKTNSTSCNSGTAFLRTCDYVNIEDWEEFLGFFCDHLAGSLIDRGIIRSDAFDKDTVRKFIFKEAPWHYIKKGVSKTAVVDYMNDEDPNNPIPPPPGIKYTTEKTVSIRSK